MPKSSDSTSATNSADVPSSAHSQPFRLQGQSRLRFYSSSDQDGNPSTWYPPSKLDAKLESFLHRALREDKVSSGHSIHVIACPLNAQDRVIAISDHHYNLIESFGLPLSSISFFEEKGQYGYKVGWQENYPQDLYIWALTPAAFIHEISCLIKIDIPRKSSVVVYFDRNEDRIDSLLQHLSSSRDDQSIPAFDLIAKLLAEYAKGSESWRSIIDARIRMMEGETGVRSQKLEMEPDKSHGFNFGRLTMDVQMTNTSLIALEYVVSWQLLMSSFVVRMWELYIELQSSYPSANSLTKRGYSDFLHDIDNQSIACELRQRRVLGAQKTMQSQISILLSLISQRDNRINIQLAQESREIAAAAKRDSKVMRIIAVLTLVFLPATLISSIFSSGIFNLGELDGNSSRVSPLWWVYAVASLASTGFVMAAGYTFLRMDAPQESSFASSGRLGLSPVSSF